jgi:hypothetical protein
MTRRLPPPWRAEKFSGGYVVRDANGFAVAYVYGRSTEDEAITAKQMTMDEAWRDHDGRSLLWRGYLRHAPCASPRSVGHGLAVQDDAWTFGTARMTDPHRHPPAGMGARGLP